MLSLVRVLVSAARMLAACVSCLVTALSALAIEFEEELELLVLDRGASGFAFSTSFLCESVGNGKLLFSSASVESIEALAGSAE